MRVESTRFVKSAMKLDDCPKDRKPEIAFAGRSNVGKSTLLNTLFGRKGLAKTSKTPGKTQTINFFLLNECVYLVDLPGYGYAKVSKSLKDVWGQAMSAYLREREPLRLAVLLLDSRHKPSDLDQQMLDLLEEAEVPTAIVATKVDKLKQSERKASIARIREELGLDDEALIIPFSSMTHAGHRELWETIESVIADQ